MFTTTLLAIDPDELDRRLTDAVARALAAYTPPRLPDPGTGPEYLSRNETAALLHLSLVTLRELERRGELVPVRISRRVLYRRSDVTAALDRSRRGKR